MQSGVLTSLKKRAFENIVRKGENAGNQHFLLYPHVFYPIKDKNYHFSNLTLSQTSPGFYVSAVHISFENTVGKGEIACNEQFLLFPQYFLLSWRTFCHFDQIQNCRLQTLSVWKRLKSVVCKCFEIGPV